MVTRFLMNVAGGRECNRRDERSVAGKQEHPNQLGDQEASCPQERRWAALHYVWSVSLYLCFRSVLSSIISVMKIISLLGITQINNQLDAKFIIYIFISILYTFRATLCSSSGESIVSIQHLVYVTLCRWPSGMQVGKELPDLHTGRSRTQSDIYQMLYWYYWLSWWWAQGCSKRVENRNKYTGCPRRNGQN